MGAEYTTVAGGLSSSGWAKRAITAEVMLPGPLGAGSSWGTSRMKARLALELLGLAAFQADENLWRLT